MLSRRVTRFQPRRGDAKPTVWQQVQQYGGMALLMLAGTFVALGLFWAPKQLAANHRQLLMDQFFSKHFEDTALVEKHWQALPWLPNFETGDEPGVREFLRKQPLVVAVLNRLETRSLWVRDGNRLIRASESPQTQTYRTWITQAEMAQRFQWLPATADDPDHDHIASTVLLGDQWIVIKRWEPGTTAVEAALRQTYGAKPPIRIGLIIESRLKRGLPVEDWGGEPNIQVDPGHLLQNARWVYMPAASDYFGKQWTIFAVPWEAQQAQFRAEISTRIWIARGTAIGVALLMVLGLWLRHRARQRALLDMDRLASLTHSLKTPLAVLKFRCDTLRLGRMSPDQTDEELIKLGEEVDRLTVIIETGLTALKGEASDGPRGVVGREWLQDVAADLEVAFEAEGRQLELNLSEESGQAALSSLRSALFTLMENALFHGEGKVTLESWRNRRRFVIRVSDEGHPLDGSQLEALGRPFMRFRQKGMEGFKREGQGLGVSLMCQVADREGWGLVFSSGNGKGLIATLEIPNAPVPGRDSRSWWQRLRTSRARTVKEGEA
ncbi:MAG: HAMP domain-containing histidine kinase [Holophagaceae bacterium]|nr:HAMP domain-containing histidine kinase [Holophagaceae bacterium]